MSGCFILKTDGASRILLVNAFDHLILTNCIPDVTGVLAVNETPDLAAFTGIISVSGILAATEVGDTALFTGSVALLPSGVLVSVEARDVAVFTLGYRPLDLIGTVPPSDWDYGVYKKRHGPPPRNWK